MHNIVSYFDNVVNIDISSIFCVNLSSVFVTTLVGLDDFFWLVKKVKKVGKSTAWIWIGNARGGWGAAWLTVARCGVRL